MYTQAAHYSKTRKLTLLAALTTIAFVLMVVGRIPVILFLKYDPKDVVIAFAGFLFGPMSALMVAVVVSFVEMVTVSTTGFIGLVMNILGSCAFACTASAIYHKKKTLKSAVIGLIAGVLLATAVMLLWNYLVVPIFMDMSRERVAQMLIPIFLPFNLIKGGLNATLTLLLYKPLVRALRGANLLPPREEGEDAEGATQSGKGRIGVMLVSTLVLITCLLTILAFQGII